MRSGKTITLFVLLAAGLAGVSFLHTAAAKSDPAAPSWTVGPPRIACGTDAAKRVSACRLVADVARKNGAAAAGTVTVLGRDSAGRELGCWDGERLAAPAVASTVHVLAPAPLLGRAASFDVLVTSWGCWGTPAALGPAAHVERAALGLDTALVDEARERARQRLQQAEEHGDPDAARGFELGPVLSRVDPNDGC